MGARGKKRRRADGSIASGKLPQPVGPLMVPHVSPTDLAAGLSLLTDSIKAAGDPLNGSAEWEAAYQSVQAILRREHGKWGGDAIIWRATLLHALLESDDFLEANWEDGELPTLAMLEVAATIYTDGSDTCFDREEFEAMIDRAAVNKPR